MTTATLDRLLAVLVLAMAGTGLATLRSGTPAESWVYILHGLFAGLLAWAVIEKLRRSLPRAARAAAAAPRRHLFRLVLGLGVSALAIAALTGGYLWVVSGEIVTIGSWTILTLHAWAGLVLVPLTVVHLLPLRWRLLRPGSPRPSTGGAPSRDGPTAPRLSRRTLGIVAVVGVLALGSRSLADALDRRRGGERRFTGSRLLASGGVPPVTTFFGEGTPPIDRDAWRLAVGGRAAGRPRAWTLAELADLPATELTALLDCTSGWAIETGWRGIALADLLAAAQPTPSARWIEVRSVTGWSTRLPIVEAGACLLATEVAGAPLPDGNGAPLRLVVPDRRGLDWVKWVDRIEIG